MTNHGDLYVIGRDKGCKKMWCEEERCVVRSGLLIAPRQIIYRWQGCVSQSRHLWIYSVYDCSFSGIISIFNAPASALRSRPLLQQTLRIAARHMICSSNYTHRFSTFYTLELAVE